MTDAPRAIPGSERAAPAGAKMMGPVPRDERITVSIYLRANEDDAGGVQSRDALRQARAAAHADDIAELTAFARQAGLQVAETDPARRLVKLSGPAAALEAAFGTELHRGEIDGTTYRVRTGALHLPGPMADRVLAVLGLDNRPVATAKIVPHRVGPPPPGFLPTQIAALYGFAHASAAGECVGIIELGGGYTDADNQAAFGAMKLPVPDRRRSGRRRQERPRRHQRRERGGRARHPGGGRRRGGRDVGGVFRAQHQPGLRRRDQPGGA